MRAAYQDQTLITRLGTVHADHARPDGHPDGRSTSAAPARFGGRALAGLLSCLPVIPHTP
jgi:hypothetical protein